jgi:hypothetical protein
MKEYKNRAMSTEKKDIEGEVYFFPKAQPPVAIRATSREEAERQLKALRIKENE